MSYVTRDRVPLLTGLLTAVSLAVVFGAAGGAIPRSAVPAPPDGVIAAIPTVNAAVSLVAIGTIATGWRAIRRGDVARHRRAMLTSVALFGAFLALYLYRLVVLGGAADFPGPAVVYQYVYLPVLAVHIGLAIVCVPLVYYVTLLAVTHDVRELPATRHPTVGRIAAALWLVSFSLGIAVYALLHVVY